MRRRHHYVPRFHLERFADDGAVFIFDRETGETRKSGTRAIAVKKNLYRIDVPDIQPDALEIALSEIVAGPNSPSSPVGICGMRRRGRIAPAPGRTLTGLTQRRNIELYGQARTVVHG